MRSGSRRHDRESEASAPRRSCTRRIGPEEPFEDCSRMLFIDSGSVVRDFDERLA
jgi:hypothetical protein